MTAKKTRFPWRTFHHSTVDVSPFFFRFVYEASTKNVDGNGNGTSISVIYRFFAKIADIYECVYPNAVRQNYSKQKI